MQMYLQCGTLIKVQFHTKEAEGGARPLSLFSEALRSGNI